MWFWGQDFLFLLWNISFEKMKLLNHKSYIKWLIRMIYVVLRPWLSIFATLHKTKNLIYHNNQTLLTCKGCKIWYSMWRDNDIPFLPFLIYHKQKSWFLSDALVCPLKYIISNLLSLYSNSRCSRWHHFSLMCARIITILILSHLLRFSFLMAFDYIIELFGKIDIAIGV